MPRSWILVDGRGFDVEEVDRPATHDAACPACGRPVRLVERVLVKNLRVFGVPLLGVENGRRVFECPRCGACVEPSDGAPARQEAGSALDQQLSRARGEVRRWTQRVELADQKSDYALWRAACRELDRAEDEVARLLDEVARAKSSPAAPRAATPATATPRTATSPRAASAATEPAGEEGFLSTLGSIVGIGVGSLEIVLDGRAFAPGDVVRGRLELALERPVDAKRLVVGIEATRERRVRRADASGRLVDGRETECVYKFEHELAGPRRYRSETLAFEFALAGDALGARAALPPEARAQLGLVGDLLTFASQVADAGRAPVQWQVFAFLDIPWKANVKKRVDVVVGPPR